MQSTACPEPAEGAQAVGKKWKRNKPRRGGRIVLTRALKHALIWDRYPTPKAPLFHVTAHAKADGVGLRRHQCEADSTPPAQQVTVRQVCCHFQTSEYPSSPGIMSPSSLS